MIVNKILHKKHELTDSRTIVYKHYNKPLIFTLNSDLATLNVHRTVKMSFQNYLLLLFFKIVEYRQFFVYTSRATLKRQIANLLKFTSFMESMVQVALERLLMVERVSISNLRVTPDVITFLVIATNKVIRTAALTVTMLS